MPTDAAGASSVPHRTQKVRLDAFWVPHAVQITVPSGDAVSADGCALTSGGVSRGTTGWAGIWLALGAISSATPALVGDDHSRNDPQAMQNWSPALLAVPQTLQTTVPGACGRCASVGGRVASARGGPTAGSAFGTGVGRGPGSIASDVSPVTTIGGGTAPALVAELSRSSLAAIEAAILRSDMLRPPQTRHRSRWRRMRADVSKRNPRAAPPSLVVTCPGPAAWTRRSASIATYWQGAPRPLEHGVARASVPLGDASIRSRRWWRARLVLVLTVPIGQPSRVAISAWVSPPA